MKCKEAVRVLLGTWLLVGGPVRLMAQDVSDTATVVLDSMQLTLMHRASSFSQIERVVKATMLTPDYLLLIPCVLPVDLPLARFRITSSFGPRRHPIYGLWRVHSGVDVKAPLGLSVKATAAGIVSKVGYDPELGAYIRLRHAFGFETVYGHLKGYCVRVGQRVRCGDVIARVGQSGAATGPHLHYTIKKNGSTVDPFQFCFLLRRQAPAWLGLPPGDTLTTRLPAALLH